MIMLYDNALFFKDDELLKLLRSFYIIIRYEIIFIILPFTLHRAWFNGTNLSPIPYKKLHVDGDVY